MCKIQDVEENSFEIDIAKKPIDVKVDLAGELEGMAIHAVSDNPIVRT